MKICSIFSIIFTVLPLLSHHCHGSPVDLTSLSGLERRGSSQSKPGNLPPAPAGSAGVSSSNADPPPYSPYPYLFKKGSVQFTPQVNDAFQIPSGYKEELRKRWIATASDSRSVLIYTDGVFDQAMSKAGYGVTFLPDHESVSIGRPVERVQGQQYTLERAKLRAVVAALQLRPWNSKFYDRYYPCEDFNHVVIATDSVYVIAGVEKGKNALYDPELLNKDLWDILWAEIARYEKPPLQARHQTKVQFWHLSDKRKDGMARAAAAAKEGMTKESTFESLVAVLFQDPYYWSPTNPSSFFTDLAMKKQLRD